MRPKKFGEIYVPSFQIKEIDPLLLKEQSFEPKVRLERSSSSMRKLVNFIATVGFLFPVIVDKNNFIITGHRRRLAAIILNLRKIPCLVSDSKFHPALMFKYEALVQRFTGLQYADMYLRDGKLAIKDSILHKLELLITICGIDYLRKLVELGINPMTVITAIEKYSRLCNDQTKVFKKAIGEYFILFPKSLKTDSDYVKSLNPKVTHFNIIKKLEF